jgi:hypothetical protein
MNTPPVAASAKDSVGHQVKIHKINPATGKERY